MMRDILEEYKCVIDDPERTDRLEDQQCQVCYYGSRIGGAAITTTECGICGVEMTFGNTNVDILCERCAREKNVCKHCGADMEYKNRRKL